jgi:plasmid stabilization system protein ParE
MKVELAPSAARQIERARLWWRENRTAAPELFDEELAHALRLLAAWPHAVGAVASNARRPGLRRHVLDAIGYLVFYRVEGESVRVLHFRHARRRGVRL